MKLKTILIITGSVWTTATIATNTGVFFGSLNPTAAGTFGGPLVGLTTADMATFLTGRDQFQTISDAPDGLGPIFNGQSCAVCHTQPIDPVNGAGVNGVGTTTGGASAINESRAGSMIGGVFNPLLAEDGTLFHRSSLTPASQEIVPPDATVIATRKATPLFGAGLLEAIPDSEIEAGVHSPAVDGVTGRPAVLTDTATTLVAQINAQIGAPVNFVGRFGWKCQESTLLAFAGDAYIFELGVTNRIFGTDLAPNGNQAALIAAEPPGITPTTLQDMPSDPTMPESPTNKDDIARFTDFMELLGQPPTIPLSPTAQVGQQLFTTVNCVACHKPSMTTGNSTISGALGAKVIFPYSDLLLHNMGSLADGIAQADAGPQEMRTAPLWGLRVRAPYLHDGRAATVLAAIQAHDAIGAESQIIAQRFKALTAVQQQDIIDFLNSI